MMENNVDLEAIQLAYQEAVEKLMDKVKILAICFAVICLVIKIVSNDMTLWGAAECSMGLTMGMYLPFKICYRFTGSVLSGMLWGLGLVIALGVALGDRRLLFSLIIIGGMILDFAWSVAKVYRLKKLLTDAVIN